jgi:hypothetical protein
MHLELFGQQQENDIFPSMAHDMMLGDDWQNVAEHMLRWLAQRSV